MYYDENGKRRPTINNTGIFGFVGELIPLSNFGKSAIYLGGHFFPSVENAYQAAKSDDEIIRTKFMLLTPRDAQKQGQLIKVSNDWHKKKEDVMFFCLVQKFQDFEMRKLLLCTKDLYLEETNDWGDQFWGVDWKSGEGNNILGKQLMMIRSFCKKKDL